MRQTTGTRKSPGEKIVKDIKRVARKLYSSEERIRIRGYTHGPDRTFITLAANSSKEP